MAEIFEDKPDKWARFTCDCFMHVLDISCYKYGDEGEEKYWTEIDCLALDHRDNTFWVRLKLVIKYLIGHGKDRHYFWNFILRRDDMRAFKEFIASLPEEQTAFDEMIEFQAKQFNTPTKAKHQFEAPVVETIAINNGWWIAKIEEIAQYIPVKDKDLVSLKEIIIGGERWEKLKKEMMDMSKGRGDK